jgi:hypothetical protein
MRNQDCLPSTARWNRQSAWLVQATQPQKLLGLRCYMEASSSAFKSVQCHGGSGKRHDVRIPDQLHSHLKPSYKAGGFMSPKPQLHHCPMASAQLDAACMGQQTYLQCC